MIKIQNLSVDYKLRRKPTTLKEFVASLFAIRNNLENVSHFALKEVNLEIEDGCRLGLIGRNGSGKSTLLKVIAGILKPDEGKILTEGNVRALLELGAGFNPELTGRENVYLHGLYYGASINEMNALIDQIVEFSDLSQYIDEPVKHYSSGMHARLGFAAATSKIADVLILDEIFAAGDDQFVKKAHARMKEMVKQAGIVILVSHDMNLIHKECNKVLWLDKGHVKLVGPPDQVISRYIAGD